MTVDDWAMQEKARLTEFTNWWNEQRTKDKELKDPLFPFQMPAGEWDEQFRSWGD